MVLSLLATLLIHNGYQVATVDANPRARRFLLPTMLIGSVTAATYSVWYASKVAPLNSLQVIAYCFSASFLVTVTPVVSFTVWGFATAERRSCKRAAKGIVFGVMLSAYITTSACVTTSYITLSDHVSGSAGVAINGTVGGAGVVNEPESI